MDAWPPVPTPQHDLSAPIGRAGGPIPAWARCGRCGYELVGLDRSGACTECGLAVGASCPAWDIGACHPLYVHRLRREAGALGAASVVLVLAAAGIGLGSALLGLAALWDPMIVQGYEGLLIAVMASMLTSLLLLVLVILLGVLWWRLRRHSNGAVAYGAAERRGARRGACLVALGTIASSALLHLHVFVPLQWAIVPATIGLGAAFLGAVVLCRSATAYVRTMLARAGVDTPAAWLERPASWLTLLGACLMPLAAIGLLGWSVAALPSLAGVTILGCGMMLDAWGANQVLGRLLPDGH